MKILILIGGLTVVGLLVAGAYFISTRLTLKERHIEEGERNED